MSNRERCRVNSECLAVILCLSFILHKNHCLPQLTAIGPNLVFVARSCEELKTGEKDSAVDKPDTKSLEDRLHVVYI